MKETLIWAIVLVAIGCLIIPHSFVNAKSSEEKAIDKALSKVGYKNVCKLGVTTKTNNQTQLIYSNSKCNPVTPPPNPPPQPTGDKTIVCLIGDLKGSTVPNKMKNCNYKIGLGDLGYGSDLSYFKSLNFNKCVIGNHDATEDGSTALYKEALAYCGDHWNLKIGQSALILGFNTNGDTASQLGEAKNVLGNPNTMANVKTVVFVSHKAGHVPPNSHHPAEAAALYNQLEALIPQGVTLYEIVGHNHVSSSAPSKNWYQAGAGGKSFYECGTDSVWTYCDNKTLQYLELTIDNQNGNTVAKFVK